MSTPSLNFEKIKKNENINQTYMLLLSFFIFK